MANIDADREPELIFISNWGLRGYPHGEFVVGVQAVNLDGGIVSGFPRVIPSVVGFRRNVFNRADTGKPALVVPVWNAIFTLDLGGCSGEAPLWGAFGGDLSGSHVATAPLPGWGAGCVTPVTEPPSFLLPPQSFDYLNDSGWPRALIALPSGNGRVTTRWQARNEGETSWRTIDWSENLSLFWPEYRLGYLYRMLASNEAGTTASEPARISFSNYPVITATSPDETVPVGSTVRLEVVAQSRKPPTYQWWGSPGPGESTQRLEGRTSSSIDVQLQREGPYYYSVFVSSNGYTESRAISITATAPTPTPKPPAPPQIAAAYQSRTSRLTLRLTGIGPAGCEVSLYLTALGQRTLVRTLRVSRAQSRAGVITLTGPVKFGGAFALGAQRRCEGVDSLPSAALQIRTAIRPTIQGDELRGTVIDTLRRFSVR
ncbi:MAG: hypothetical protein EBZ48_10440 [Proteobacteria bacterium]|nr:hypothetical protein [Pseudomonadota bacterium]